MEVKVYTAAPGEIKAESWFVRQFRVREYPAAFKVLDDEIALCARSVDKPADAVGNLLPESYEEIHRTMREVNKEGFFSYAARQMARATESLKEMPIELVNNLIRLAPTPLNSPMPLPIGQRPPGSR